MNWAGPSYNRVGLEIASALSEGGYPTDLIPSSLAGTSALHLDEDGCLCLGPQRYRAVVLYQPEFGDDPELAFLERAAQGSSAMFLVGDWTQDSEARPIEAMTRLGRNVRAHRDDESCAAAVAQFLNDAGVARVTGWSGRLPGWGQSGSVFHATPPTEGYSTLTDGTYVRVAGSKDPAGHPIDETFTWQGHANTAGRQFIETEEKDGTVEESRSGGEGGGIR